LEDALDVLLSVRLARPLGHQLHEFLKSNLTAIVGVEDRHGDVDKRTARLVSAVLPDGFAEVHGGEHAVVIFVEVVEDLLEHFHVSQRALSYHVLLGVEIHVFLGAEAGTLGSSLLRSARLVLLVTAAAPAELLWQQSLRTHKYIQRSNKI